MLINKHPKHTVGPQEEHFFSFFNAEIFQNVTTPSLFTVKCQVLHLPPCKRRINIDSSLWCVLITVIIFYSFFSLPLSKPIGYCQRAEFRWEGWVHLFVFLQIKSQSNLELCWTCSAAKSRKPAGTGDRLDPATTLLLLHPSLPILLYHFVSSRRVVSTYPSLCALYSHLLLLLHFLLSLFTLHDISCFSRVRMVTVMTCKGCELLK